VISTTATIAPTAPVEQELRWLDQLVGRPNAYARLWVACVRESGAMIRADRTKLLASWPIDDRHAERGEHLKILTTHMDDAGLRAAVIKLLEAARCPVS